MFRPGYLLDTFLAGFFLHNTCCIDHFVWHFLYGTFCVTLFFSRFPIFMVTLFFVYLRENLIFSKCFLSIQASSVTLETHWLWSSWCIHYINKTEKIPAHLITICYTAIRPTQSFFFLKNQLLPKSCFFKLGKLQKKTIIYSQTLTYRKIDNLWGKQPLTFIGRVNTSQMFFSRIFFLLIKFYFSDLENY